MGTSRLGQDETATGVHAIPVLPRARTGADASADTLRASQFAFLRAKLLCGDRRIVKVSTTHRYPVMLDSTG